MALDTSLLSYWKLDGNSNDSKGSNNGTDTNVTYSTTNAIIGQAANFSDTGYATMGNVLDFDGTGAFSISAWVRISATGIYQEIVSKSIIGSTYRGYNLIIYPANTVYIEVINDGITGPNMLAVGGGTVLSTSSTYHVVATYDGSKAPSGVKIYINGSSESLTTGSNTLTGTSSNSGPFNIGNRADNAAAGSYAFNGLIDEVAVWEKVLSQAEVTQLYNSGAGLAYPFPTAGGAFLLNFA